MKIEVQIFIPVTDNDGNLFTPGHDKDFLHFVVAELGGCSMLPASVVGVWQEDGITYDDHSRVLVLAVDGLIAQGGAGLSNRHAGPRPLPATGGVCPVSWSQ